MTAADRALREALLRLQDVGFSLDEVPMEAGLRRVLQAQITEAADLATQAVRLVREERDVCS